MECTTSLEQRLVDTPSTSDNTNSRACRARHSLLGTRGQTDAGLVIVGRVPDDRSVVAGRPREGAAVADLLLDVADDGAFWALRDGEGVPDGEHGLLAAVDEGTGVHALGGDEGLLAELVPVWVAEDDAGKGRTTARVVDDLLHYAADVAIALSEVEVA